MPQKPELELIVDLHTHFFNARCLPLPGIFANAMDKNAGESRFARALARLVVRLTETTPLDSYSADEVDPEDVEAYITRLSDLTVRELFAPLGENLAAESLTEGEKAEAMRLAEQRIVQSDLYGTLVELDTALQDEAPDQSGSEEARAAAPIEAAFMAGWARRVVERAFRTLQRLAKLRDDIGNYAAFVFNMLHTPEHMVRTLVRGYGERLPQIQFVHQMMDMQMAYVAEDTPAAMVAPNYPYFDTQMQNMQALAGQHRPHIMGFGAFDPRRDGWRKIAEAATAMGFRGFKFYPAMGYLPFGDPDQKVRECVAEFFDYCLEAEMAVFTHCTPVGFQTRWRRGANADPLNWERLLSHNSRLGELRLCFGHAGGGDARNGDVHSPGWMAEQTDWALGRETNYAVTVARLCRSYPNVYCEFGYLNAMIEGPAADRRRALARFTSNLGTALQKQPGQEYDLGDKIAYGTDWHMPSIVRQPRAYLDVFLALFEEEPFAQYRDRFFWKNAYRYLELA